jgi:hypothetical protein
MRDIDRPNCASIALATKNNIQALFARKEEELKKILKIKHFVLGYFSWRIYLLMIDLIE